jgi:NAD(P)-dependent dehydrogenase (short-subunit alcohol dehydrogenase family)
MRALITGAATGIGAATVQKLKAAGYEVTAFDIVEPTGADHWIKVDMSDRDAIDAAVSKLSGTFGCLVNNAGVTPREGLMKTVLAVNYLGLVRLTGAVEPMLKQGGAIVNVASRAGAAWRANIEQVKALIALENVAALDDFIANQDINYVRAYDLSKEAVVVWGIANTERLLAKSLRVNSVSPAAVSTGILNDFEAAFGDRMTRNVARVGRPGYPEEIADVILYLLSAESGWIKGQDITIDGGMSALGTSVQLGL